MAHLNRVFIALAILSCLTTTPALAASEQQEIVDKSRITVDSFIRSGDMGGLQSYLRRAHGVIVIPQLLKAAFFFGGSGGSGVLMARNTKSGSWSHPSFVTMGSGSIGLQFGAEAQEIILVIMTKKGLSAVLKNKVTLGGDASVAAGPVGAGGKVAATTNLSDMYAFARSKGLFAGISLEGAVIESRDKWNASYYKRSVKPNDIVTRRQVKNAGAQTLVNAMNKLSR